MERLLCKFKVGSVTDFGEKNFEAKLSPVVKMGQNGVDNENASFSKYTPSGDMRLMVNNPDKEGFFKAGQEVYITITHERPDYQQHEDLLRHSLNVLENPGEFNNKQLHNLKAAIRILLNQR